MITCISIDDDPLFLKILESYLEEIKGIELLGSYNNPVDGIMQVVKRKPNILFIDWDMPNLDGFETLATLDKKPKVIMISANVNQPVRSKIIEIDSYLRKVKFDKEVLEAAIQRVMRTS